MSYCSKAFLIRGPSLLLSSIEGSLVWGLKAFNIASGSEAISKNSWLLPLPWPLSSPFSPC